MWFKASAGSRALKLSFPSQQLNHGFQLLRQHCVMHLHFGWLRDPAYRDTSSLKGKRKSGGGGGGGGGRGGGDKKNNKRSNSPPYSDSLGLCVSCGNYVVRKYNMCWCQACWLNLEWRQQQQFCLLARCSLPWYEIVFGPPIWPGATGHPKRSKKDDCDDKPEAVRDKNKDDDKDDKDDKSDKGGHGGNFLDGMPVDTVN